MEEHPDTNNAKQSAESECDFCFIGKFKVANLDEQGLQI